MSNRSDAEILELLRSARPDEAAMDATVAHFAATRPAGSFTSPAPEAGGGREGRDTRQRHRSVSIAVAAAAVVVVVGVAAALLALRSTATDPGLVPATQTTEAPVGPVAPPATWVGPDGGVIEAPIPVPDDQPAPEGEVSPSGGGAAPVPPATTPAAPVAPSDGGDGGPLVPPAVAPVVVVVPNPTVAGRAPLPFCGTIVADHVSLADVADRAMTACFWALVDAGIPAEVIWTGTDAAGRPFALVARHLGDRRSETYKLHPDASGADAWFVQRCTNLRPGADLLSMDPAQTLCGADVPI